MLNFKLHQRETLTKILHLQSPNQLSFNKTSAQSISGITSTNSSISSPILNNGSFATQWKVLVLDAQTRTIVGPLFTLPQLKDEGVTLLLSITQPRELVRGVPAMYLVSPTASNIALIIADLNKQLYDEFYINFTSIPAGFLEQFATRLATECINPDLSTIIKQVNNAMCEYICLEENCITFGHKQSYLSLYSPLLTESSVKSYIETIGNNLLTMIYQVYINTNGSIPYLYLPQSPRTPSHLIGRYICQQLPQTLSPPNPNGSTALMPNVSPLVKRWRLLIVDRHFNMASQLMQNLQYSPLIYDLGFNHGQVTLPNQSADQPTSPQPAPLPANTVTIDNSDTFWFSNRYKILPDVAETVHNTTIQYKNEITRINNIMAMSANNTTSNSTNDYNSIISTLPLLTKKKTQLDAHYSICSTLVSTVSQRQIHKSWPLELNMLAAQFKVGLEPTHSTGNQQASISSQAQELVKFLTTAHQNALKAHENESSSPQTMTSEQYAGSLTPFDRLRLLAMLTLSGFPFSTPTNTLHNQTYSQLVDGLKKTHNDPRYLPNYHTTQRQVEHILQFCRSLYQTVAMQQNTTVSSQQTNQNNSTNTMGSALGKFATTLLGGPDKQLTPLSEITLNTTNFTTVSSAQGKHPTNPHYATMLLIDPLMATQQQPQQSLPAPQVLQALETMAFVVGAGNWTEYMSLCGDYSNFTYLAAETTSAGQSNTHIGYDSTTQQKHRANIGITAPSGLVYGSTEMVTTRDLFGMIDSLIEEEKSQKSQ